MSFIVIHQLMPLSDRLATQQPAVLTVFIDCFVVFCALVLATKHF